MQICVYIYVSPSASPGRAQAFVTILLANSVEQYAITPGGRCKVSITTIPTSASARRNTNKHFSLYFFWEHNMYNTMPSPLLDVEGLVTVPFQHLATLCQNIYKHIL